MVFIGKLEREQSVGRPVHRWEANIKISPFIIAALIPITDQRAPKISLNFSTNEITYLYVLYRKLSSPLYIIRAHCTHRTSWLSGKHSVFRRFRPQISARRPAILSEVFRDFPQSLQANAWYYYKLSHQNYNHKCSDDLCVQTGSGAHPASCTVGTGDPFPGGKSRPGRYADHSPHLVPRSRMSRSNTSFPPAPP
jgi:hypothetical protein